MERKDLTQEQVRAALDYDPETGIFRWRKTGRGVVAGRVAGSKKEDGYISIRFCNSNRMAHRLAWLYMTGQWPEQQIDHIDGDPSNNAFSNLRDVSASWNQQNRYRPQRRNKIGLIGVQPHGNRFRAEVNIANRRVYQEYFATPEEAHAAYLAAKRRLQPGATR